MPVTFKTDSVAARVRQFMNFKFRSDIKIKIPIAKIRQYPEIKLGFKNVPDQQLLQDLIVANDLAIEYTALYLGKALDAAMDASVWRWRDGSRDIIDTGELKSSLSIISNSKGLTIDYGAAYAALVHYGGYIIPYGDPKNKPVYLPPRPWVQSVIFGGGPVDQFDFEAIYNKAFNEVLS